MSSPARAIAWEFRQRHRWGLIALVVYFIVLAAVKLMVLHRGRPVELETPERFALIVVVPLTATFTYFLAVFSFGLAGDLAARQSTYPSRMFSLPVTSSALAGWPMLFGSAAMTILWLATRAFAEWPSGVSVPVIWPALLAAALLAWTQALTWMPYGVRGFRVILTVLWLAVIDSAVLLALHYEASELVMIAILAPQIPLAYLLARHAVARSRRGDVPVWRLAMRAGSAPSIGAPPSWGNSFSSPARAQAWLEWRRHGRILPALVGLLLPFELAPLFLAGNTPSLVFAILLGVLLTPPVMASFAAATVRKSGTQSGDTHGLTAFIATRPMTTAGLVAAKLVATIRSAVTAWLLVWVAVPLGLWLSGTGPLVIDRARRVAEAVGTTRAIVLLVLTLAGLLAFTWKQLVQTLFVGLTGRDWVVKSSALLTLALLAGLLQFAVWLDRHSGAVGTLWNAIPLILWVLIGCKVFSAAWIATRLFGGRVLSDRALVTGAAGWAAMVLALYGLLVWLFSMPFLPHYLLGLLAILAIPLVRLSAAPLALAWNRHR